MTTTTVCIDRIRDLFDGDIFKSQAGTGTEAPTSSDTSLQTPDSNTLLTVSTSTASQSIQVTHTISSTIGAGNAYSEQELQINSGSTMANRIVHEPLTKGANDEFVYITNYFFTSV